MNEYKEMNPEENPRSGVILSVLRLSRALRRCPPERRDDLPPAMGRLLACVRANSGVTSRDLCEILDLRPSSLSEMLSRGEEAGWLTRAADEKDRRIQHISLTEEGLALSARREADRQADDEKKTACFSEEEAKQFCELSRRLAAHLESVGADRPPRRPPFPGEGGPGCPPPFRHRPGPRTPAWDGKQEDETEEGPEGRFPPGARIRC